VQLRLEYDAITVLQIFFYNTRLETLASTTHFCCIHRSPTDSVSQSMFKTFATAFLWVAAAVVSGQSLAVNPGCNQVNGSDCNSATACIAGTNFKLNTISGTHVVCSAYVVRLRFAFTRLLEARFRSGDCNECDSGPNGNVQAGYYCVGGNTALCPAGSYCPATALSLPVICPKDHFCKSGFAGTMLYFRFPFTASNTCPYDSTRLLQQVSKLSEGNE